MQRQSEVAGALDGRHAELRREGLQKEPHLHHVGAQARVLQREELRRLRPRRERRRAARSRSDDQAQPVAPLGGSLARLGLRGAHRPLQARHRQLARRLWAGGLGGGLRLGSRLPRCARWRERLQGQLAAAADWLGGGGVDAGRRALGLVAFLVRGRLGLVRCALLGGGGLPLLPQLLGHFRASQLGLLRREGACPRPSQRMRGWVGRAGGDGRGGVGGGGRGVRPA